MAKNQGQNPSNSAALRYYSRVHYYFILTCHYKLLYNIIAHCYLLFNARTLFHLGNYSSSMPCPRGIQSVYKIIYGISIVSWASKFITTISYLDIIITGMKTLVISVCKKYGMVIFEGAVQLKLFPETKIKPFE